MNRHLKTLVPRGRRLMALVTVGLLAAIAIAATPAAQAAAPPLLWQKCPSGADAGQCAVPRGVAVDPATGHLFVAEQTNPRVSEYTAWGEFVRAFGWDVAPEGAPGDTLLDELESCTTACQAGTRGSGAGQFDYVQGLAVDSAGYLYAIDFNLRVQKFDTSGAAISFDRMFGGDVNQGPTNPGDVCTAVDLFAGDTCGAGIGGTGPAHLNEPRVGDYIAIGPSDEVYVGDAGRIQRFDTAGNYVSEISVPGETVSALAVGPSGDLYVSVLDPDVSGGCCDNKPDVRELDSSTGTVLGTIAVDNPTAIAVAPNGDIYVVDGRRLSGAGETTNVLGFDSIGVPIGEPFGSDVVRSSGLETSSACGVDGLVLYVSNLGSDSPDFVRAYGDSPDASVCPPPAVAPAIADQYASSVGSDTADLGAKINPRFWADTTYYVQYGLQDCSANACADQPAAPGTGLGTGVVDADTPTAPVHLTGLQPGTTYHYRFVAQSSGGGPAFGPDRTFRTFAAPAPAKTDCPNQAFRTGPSAALPNCRAYEMVSPLDKNNSDIITDGADMGSSDGERFTFTSKAAAFADPLAAPFTPQYLAARDPLAGWRTSSISPPRNSVSLSAADKAVQFRGFSEDLCDAWLFQDVDVALAPGAPAGVPNLYRRDNCGADAGRYEAITNVSPPGWGVELDGQLSAYYPTVQGSSADGTLTAFRANAKLTPDASANDVYQTYSYRNGQVKLVSVLPNGEATPTNSSVGTPQGIATESWGSSVHHAVSSDGSRVFWSDSGVDSPSHREDATWASMLPGRIYVRIDPDPGFDGDEVTTAVSESVTAGASTFRTASPDGSRAIFTVDIGPLAGDLYSFDVDSETPTLIAHNVEQGAYVGASDDATKVYFISPDDLAAGATEGQPNLYLYEEGGNYSFVSTVSSDEVHARVANPIALSPSLGSTIPSTRLSRVSPDGLHVVFTSNAAPTGFDNREADTGAATAQVYLYSAAASGGSGDLRCLSCNPTGARPVGRNSVGGNGGTGEPDPYWISAQIPGWEDQLHAGRFLADDGRHVFFESYDALLQADVNDKKDVYQWEAEGAEDCDAADAAFVEASAGCLSLVTSGNSQRDSELVDATADGSDVFFTTLASLVAQDPGLVDIYDARVGGGFAAPPAPPAPCEGDSCQTPAPAPDDGGSGSSTFSGPGNGSPEPAGRVRIVNKIALGTGVSLRVKVTGKGVITGAGKNLRGVKQRVVKAGTYRLVLRLTATGRRALARKRMLTVTVRVRFAASGGSKSQTTAVLRLKLDKKANKARAARTDRGGAK